MNPSKAERARLQSVRYQDVNIVKERVPGWRKLVAAGLAEVVKVPGVELWVARSTEAGRALSDRYAREAQAEAHAYQASEYVTPKRFNPNSGPWT